MSTETKPLVSVIVRSMGRAELHEALDSVAMQTYPAIEVVVVNAVGAQHPPLGERCGRFPLRLIGNGDRLQRSAAGNYGLDQARGRYLILLDEDDWFLDSHIAGLVAQLQQSSHARLAYAGVRGVCRRADGSWQELQVFNEPYSATRLLLQNYIPMHAALFERSLIEAGCRLDETLDRYEDWDLWMQIAQHTPFIHLDEITAVYRSGEASGFGINGDEAVMKRWEIAVFEKWRGRWSMDQLLNIVQAAKCNTIDAELDALRQRCMQQESLIAEQQMQLQALQTRLEQPAADEPRQQPTSAEAVCRQPAHTQPTGSKWRSSLRRYRNYLGVSIDILRYQGPRILSQRIARKLVPQRFNTMPDRQRFEPAAHWNPLSCPPADAPRTSIILPTAGEVLHTYSCLQAILEQTPAGVYEIFVLDDGACAETSEMLERSDGLHSIRSASEPALSSAAQQARGEWLVLLGAHSVVMHGWLSALLDTFAALPGTGLVGGRVVAGDGRLRCAGGVVLGDGTLRDYGAGDNPDKPYYNYRRQVDYCDPACLMLPRRLFQALDGFDQRLDDARYRAADLAFRVKADGHDVVYQPQAGVVDLAPVAPAKPLKNTNTIGSATIFAAKWKQQLQTHGTPGVNLDLEKDRQIRKRLLVVDSLIPSPDRDSGSLRMVRLLKVFQELGFKVTFATANLEFRQPYVGQLQNLGVEVLYSPYVSSVDRFLVDRGSEFDLVLLSRVNVADRYVDRVRQFASRATVIFDTVDLHFLREQRLATLNTDKTAGRRAEQRLQQELGVVRRVDATLVVSTAEKQVLMQYVPDQRIEVVSNIHTAVGSTTPFAERAGIIFVGAFDHLPNIDAVLYFAREIAPQVHAELGPVKTYIVGSSPPKSIRALHSEQFVVTGYVEDLVPLFNQCRLSVAPLRYGSGAKGKVNTSMSFGVPVVATSIAAEGMHLTHEHDVLIADDPASFSQAVIRLYRDRQLWQKISDGGLDTIERWFAPAVCRQTLEQLLASLGDDIPSSLATGVHP